MAQVLNMSWLQRLGHQARALFNKLHRTVRASADPALAAGQRPELDQRRVHRPLVADPDVPLVDEEDDAEAEEGEAVAGPGPAEGGGGRGGACGAILRPPIGIKGDRRNDL